MKITITFNDEELHNFLEVGRELGADEDDLVIKDEHVAGRFGEVKAKFARDENKIDLNFKPNFVFAMNKFICAVAGIVKQFINMCEMFGSSWFEDVEHIEETISDDYAEGKHKVCEDNQETTAE